MTSTAPRPTLPTALPRAVALAAALALLLPLTLISLLLAGAIGVIVALALAWSTFKPRPLAQAPAPFRAPRPATRFDAYRAARKAALARAEAAFDTRTRHNMPGL